ncbi:MAG: cyclic peptide export ABC transporter [Pyrinomonadaceae bacterium]
MKLISFLLRCSRSVRYSRLTIAFVIFIGVVSGACNVVLLSIINAALHRSDYTATTLAWKFAVVCLLLPLSRFASQALLVRFSARVIFDLRMNLCRRVLAAPLRLLEGLGPHRILAILTEDIPIIADTLVNVPLICMHLAIVGGCLVYLGWLSFNVLLGVLLFMVIGVVGYRLVVKRAIRYFRLARDQWDMIFQHFRALTQGTKELKLHRRRREAFFSETLATTHAALQRHSVAGETIFNAVTSAGQTLFFILVGLILFLVPFLEEDIDARTLTGYTLTILYMMTPIEVLLNRIPGLGRANVAAQKVEKLGIKLAASTTEESMLTDTAVSPSWGSLELSKVTHAYHREGEENTFTLGPLSLTFHPGEMVFIAGGNGSGKTTFAKLLCGLYPPETGKIRFNGKVITDHDRDFYRQHFSVVFSDFFLFESLIGLNASELDERARNYLSRLELERKVEVKDGTLSTLDLSQGQRKRLALLTAYLEDRPIYLFDEWAADQDPHFKEIFYYELVPELKARGKTVIVITHDDRFFQLADRLIKLDYGRVEYDKRMTEGAQAVEEVPASTA